VSSPVDPPQARGVVGKSASSGDGATSSWRNDGSEMGGFVHSGKRGLSLLKIYRVSESVHSQQSNLPAAALDGPLVSFLITLSAMADSQKRRQGGEGH